ncbi:MAG: NTP transferase domain-containing protein [Deltaproteobacteria bacterium]|nr:NTP transferase domain-containing protein [Deltaproteobacteria bacterium]MBW2019839.1 NTP transferase domain-containing protein [Deltaproteobacteria bacterium]MBW2074643.1 NTP transferase domain-containing protein [Deltaproteobacteria bacterium]
MKCLIIAAGRGSRLQHKCDSKPLVPVLGKPIVERVIRSAVRAGIDDFYVVTGYNGAKVCKFLNTLAGQCRINITPITNEEWDKGNGLSVLKAKRYLNENFILMMGDHLVDSGLLNSLRRQQLPEGEVMLAVDRNMDNPLIDMTDATKVKIKDGKVVSIGKDLKTFNGFDTGIFLCSPQIFQGIAESVSKHGDSSLSGGLRCLGEKGKVNVFDIKGRFWIDVDDSVALKKAEKALLSDLRSKQNDGPISRYLNRPVSVRISRYLAKFPITPNQISFISFLLSIFAAGLFITGGYQALLTGGILAQFASIIDGCDGEIARLKFQESAFGGWFDAVLDRYADAFLLFGLTWHDYFKDGNPASLFVGFMAIIGSFMVSYTADKYDALMYSRLKSGIRIGRDVRVFLIFLGALLNQSFWTLLFIAVLMNTETVRRVYICRTDE